MRIYTISISCIMILAGCTIKEELQPVKKEGFCLNEKIKNEIKLINIEKQNIIEGVHLTGMISTNPDQVVNFVSLVNGIISNVHFSLGDAVKKGQVLAEMQSTELASLRSELSALQSQIEIAQLDLKAKEQLFKDGISSNKELLSVKNELRILESEKQRIESNLSLYSASNIKNVFQIKAIASGIITEKNINPGLAVTNEGTTLFSISNLQNVWVMANIYARDIGHIGQGMPVEIKTLSYPDEVFKGKIDMISQILDQDAKVLKARIVLDNKDFKLKPGMVADIIGLKNSNQQALTVPTSSVIFFNNKNYVLIYKSDCDIAIREIEILSKKNDLTYLKSGVKEDEKVIAKNQLLIFEEINNN